MRWPSGEKAASQTEPEWPSSVLSSCANASATAKLASEVLAFFHPRSAKSRAVDLSRLTTCSACAANARDSAVNCGDQANMVAPPANRKSAPSAYENRRLRTAERRAC